MSSTIWTQSAGAYRIRRLTAAPWRVVEAQHRVATRKLVRSDAAQAVLEELIEAQKPPAFDGGRLHYLLFTPFRYPPLPHGSRFGSATERGVWYGSDTLRAAFAEVAYYRLLFLEGTAADLGLLEADLTAFRARVHTRRGIDLTRPPFTRWRRTLASKVSYAATQPLGTAMRTGGVEAVRYMSARDSEGGSNVALFAPTAFAVRRPVSLQTWRSAASREAVEISKHDYFERVAFRFPRAQFLVRGRLPQPGTDNADRPIPPAAPRPD